MDTGQVCGYWVGLWVLGRAVDTGHSCGYWASLWILSRAVSTGQGCVYWASLEALGRAVGTWVRLSLLGRPGNSKAGHTGEVSENGTISDCTDRHETDTVKQTGKTKKKTVPSMR